MKTFFIAFFIILLIGLGAFFYSKSKTPIAPEPVSTVQPMPIEAQIPNPPAPVTNPLISVESPSYGETVHSPLVVKGEARGNWYFEASFPVKLFDANGVQIAAGAAQAQGDWMTTNFVPFSITLTFATPSTSTGTLVLEKDNPSGEPQNDDSITIPVNF